MGPNCVSKTALQGLVNTLSTELGPEGIQVNSIAPGMIRRKFSEPVCMCVCNNGKETRVGTK